MTNNIGALIRTVLVTASLATGVGSVQAQNLTFFREYDTVRPVRGSSGFAVDGKGGLYSLIGDTIRKYDSGGAELWIKQIGIAPLLGVVTGLTANSGGVFVAGGTLIR